MKGKKKRWIAWICIFTLTLGIPVCPHASGDLLGEIGEYVFGEGGLLDEQEIDLSDELEIIEQAIVYVMNTEWYQNTDAEERIDLIAEALAATGYVDKDTVKQGINNILDFEFHGQTIGVLLSDYTRQLYDASMEDQLVQEDQVGSDRSLDSEAVLLYGLGFPDVEQAYDYSILKWGAYGLRTDMDRECTLDDFKSKLSGKDLIIIEEHGDFYENMPIVVTQERYDPDSGRYQDDLDSGRAGIVMTTDGTYYYMTPDFFRYYYSGGGLQNAIVWIGSCYGNHNSALADAFASTGASAVLAHSNAVYTAYDYNLLNTVVDKMIDGQDMRSAFEEAKAAWGENDTEYANVYLNIAQGEEKETSVPQLSGNMAW